MFDATSSLPLLVDRGGKLIWSAEENASLFSAHFDAKLCSSFSAAASLCPFTGTVFCCLPF